MIKGIVCNIKETNKFSKFFIGDEEYIYFKNKSNAFDEHIKSKSKVMKLLFDGSFVEITANKKNIVEDLFVDLKRTDAALWYPDFQRYLKLIFKSYAVEKLIAKASNASKASSEGGDDLIGNMITHASVLSDSNDPYSKTLQKDVLDLVLFYKAHYEQLGLSNLLKSDVMSCSHNIKQVTLNKHIKKISKKVNYNTFKKNPYGLLDGTTAQLFETLSAFAKTYELSNEQNLEGVINHCLFEVMKNGHTCYPLETICKHVFTKMAQLFDVVTVEEIKEKIVKNKFYKVYEDQVMFASLFKKQEYVAKRIQDYIDMYHDKAYKSTTGKDELGIMIDDFEFENGIEFNVRQKKAIIRLFQSERGITLMTGLPGSGKTSVVKCITFISKLLKLKYALTAPTGKSANRLGNEAFTVHRLLEPIPVKDGSFKFGKTEKDPINFDIIVADEISMFDSDLFYSFIKACKPTTRLLLIGDNNQLPSVKYGDVLNSLIESKMIPHTHLSKVYRQANKSSIPLLAKCIVDKKIPDKSMLNNESVTFVEMENEKSIRDYVLKYYKSHQSDDDVILIPTKKCETGTVKMNDIIHNETYSGHPENVKKYIKGEKIICISNTYVRDSKGVIDIQRSIFNGDNGIFVKYCQDLEIEMFTKEKASVMVPLESIEYGYTITVHKSQGSEYSNVLLILHHTHNMMLNNQVLYTAITRAKNHITIVGTMECIEKCINTSNSKRFDVLDLLIREGLEVVS
jgi:exodeoxyribonuclease V alpha subunit